jgi:hypothetical protein
MKLLEVESSKTQFIAAVLLGLFIVPMSLLTVAGALKRGFRFAPFALGLVMLVGYCGVIWVMTRARARSVKYFTDEGLWRADGRNFAWKDLSRVVKQINKKRHSYRSFHWRTEIHFRNGESAWLIPKAISNFDEVSDYVDRLPCEHTEVIVG